MNRENKNKIVEFVRRVLASIGEHLNTIYLENWNGQPIHCPFCGTALNPDSGSGVVDCRHWLYTQYAEFLERSDRYNVAIGFPPDDLEADIGSEAREIVERNRERFFNLVEYQIASVSDVTCVGFAPIDEELVYWGHREISPYQRN